MYGRAIVAILCLTMLRTLLPATGLRADVPVVEASLSRDSISIGDQLSLDVIIRKDMMQVVEFPVFPEGKLSEYFYVVSEAPVDTLSDGRSQTLTKRYTITTFKAGMHNMGRFPVMYVDKNIVDTLYSANDMQLLVTTLDVDTGNGTINPIKRPENTPFLGAEIFGYAVYSIAGLCVLAAVAYLIIRYRRKHRPARGEPVIRVPQEAAHVIAIRKLEDLHHKKLWQNNLHKQYYSGLTDILREYIGNRYRTSVMEKTTDEIIGISATFDLDKINAGRLTTLLRTSDLVKFAKYIPDADYNEKAFSDTYYFIEDTKITEDGAEKPETINEGKEDSDE